MAFLSPKTSLSGKIDHRYRMPKEGSSEADFESHFDYRIDYMDPLRNERIREYQVARAMVLSHQWLDADISVRDANRTVRFTDPDPKSRIPKPVNNEIYPIVDNESAKLYRRKSTAYVRPVAIQEGTAGAGGASAANDIMDWHLETIRWPRKRRIAIYRDVLYGTTFFWSYLDQSYMDTVKIGITDARRCVNENCDFMLAGDYKIPYDDMMESPFKSQALNSDRVQRETKFDTETGDTSVMFEATKCLQCGAPLKTGYSPTDESEIDGEDPFGHSFSKEVPINQPDIEIVSPYDVWPMNGGIGYDDPGDIREWYRATPRSIDHWIADHYPDAVERVRPDKIDEITNYHPLATGYAFREVEFSRTNAWHNTALVKTAVIDRCKAYPLGRYVEMAGGTLLRDTPLYRKSERQPGVIVPLVKVTCARFIIKDGEIWGQGIVKPLVSLQNRINMTLSQIVDTRQRNGVSGILGTVGMRFTSGWLDGYAGRFVRWEPDPQHPDLKPEFIDTKTMDQGVYQELDRTVDRMQQISGTQDVDIGKAPKNVSAATAIQVLQESAAGRREGREQELIDAFKECYSHQLLLLAEYAIEPRTYRLKARNGKWEYRQFRGSDLAGHTDVMVEEQAGYDQRAFLREALVQAINLQIVTISSPFQRREACKVLGLTPSLSDEENLQISDCEARWYAFRDFEEIPIVDESLDDHWLFYQGYGLFLKTSEGREMAEKYLWAEQNALLSGWEDKLVQATQVEAQVKALSGAAQSGDLQAGMALQGIVAGLAQQGETVDSIKLPAAAPLKILYVWQRMGLDVTNPFVAFRASFEAHKLLAQAKKGLASLGPQMAAPGGGQTIAGTEPIQGAPSLPGPGEEASGVPAGGASPAPVQA